MTMTDQALTLSLTADSLLAHEPYLRRLARALLADEHAAEDLVQDTYRRALEHPAPAGFGRAWLGRIARNLAIDGRRTRARRRAREEAAARDEALDSTAAFVTRMSLQREVVDAVLSLPEPYRSVVVAHHFEGKDAATIALATGRTASTVRSQLSRAHARLRERLDEQVEGGRAQWAAFALGAARTCAPLSWGGSMSWGGWSTAALIVACVGGAFAARGLQGDETLSGAQYQPAPNGPAPRPSAPAAATAAAATTSTDQPAATPPADDPAQDPTTSVDRDHAEKVADLFEQAVQLQRHLRRVAFAPKPELLEQEAELLALPDTGMTRLRDRRAHGQGSRLEQLTGVRGAGAYYSFATRQHSYDSQPDVELQGGRLSSGFYGGTIGMVFDLGDLPLASLSTTGEEPPAELEDDGRMRWDWAWLAPEELETQYKSGTLRSDVWRETSRDGVARIGTTYLLRRRADDEHDVLVAFRLVDLNDEEATLVWRQLAEFDVPNRRGSNYTPEPYPQIGPGPEGWAEFSEDELIERLSKVQRRGTDLLLSVSNAAREDSPFPGSAEPGDHGWLKLSTSSDTWGPLIEAPGGGNGYSFKKSGYFDWQEADFAIRNGQLASGFRGGEKGLLLDLGALSDGQQRSLFAGEVPADLEEPVEAAVELLQHLPIQRDDRGRASLDRDHRTLLDGARVAESVAPRVGHCYLLHTGLHSDREDLIALKIVAQDRYGYSFAWRLLRREIVQER